jgi:predicted RNA-binding Zn-ribbon protein involved in translation (DUF1610 family)
MKWNIIIRRIFMCWWGGCEEKLGVRGLDIYFYCPHCGREFHRVTAYTPPPRGDRYAVASAYIRRALARGGRYTYSWPPPPARAHVRL